MKKFHKLWMKWNYADAEWYHFWLPQSGGTGGIIMGCLIGLVVAFLVFFVKL